MRVRRARLTGLSIVTMAFLLAGPLVLHGGAAADEVEAPEIAEGVEPADEAWFFRFRDPFAGVPPEVFEADPSGGFLGVGRAEARTATNPFPEDTLHVGTLAGQPYARTFIGLPTFDLTDEGEATIVGGQLTIVDNEEVTTNAEDADMVACAATDMVIGADGGNWEDQYGFDCGIRAEVVLDETADPLEWTIDLGPFAEAFEAGPPGIAIVDAATADGADDDPRVPPEPQDTWHVSFDSSLRTPESMESDGSNLGAQLVALSEQFSDPATLEQAADDPEGFATGMALIGLSLPPSATGDVHQAVVVDEERELRPPQGDVEFVVQDTGDMDFADLDGFGEFDAEGTGGNGGFDADGPDPLAAGPEERSGGDRVGTDDRAGFAPDADARAPSQPEPEPEPGPAADMPESEEPVAADGEPQDPQAAGPETEDAAAGMTPALYLLPLLALGLVGLLGYSLTAEPQLPGTRQGAVSRLMQRRRIQGDGP